MLVYRYIGSRVRSHASQLQLWRQGRTNATTSSTSSVRLQHVRKFASQASRSRTSCCAPIRIVRTTVLDSSDLRPVVRNCVLQNDHGRQLRSNAAVHAHVLFT